MLSAFICETAFEPFQWGKNDCALWVASAVFYETGQDPAADLRGAYSSGFGCRRIVMAAGGLVSLVTPRMAACGLRDFDGSGAILAKLDGQTLCGLMVEGRALFKTQSGLRVVDQFSVIRGWSW